MSPFSLKRAVSSAIRFTRSETVGMKLIDLVTDSDQVIGSEQQIVQVLINLLMNASYAVTRAYPGDGGIIRLTSSLDSGGTSVSIQVEDNGPGISPEHMERLFDPFFTTKPVGEGMGLGLSICHSILQRHNSSFRILRTADGFTSFQFSLDISDATRQPHSEPGYANA
jgi:two-component system sensor histidine kinase PhcS